jgi:hypothetical protein
MRTGLTAVAAFAVAATTLLAGPSAPSYAAGDSPTVTIEFVSASAKTVKWRLKPDPVADLYVWDSLGACKAHGGADCGAMESGGAGRFFAAGSAGQAFEISQEYTTKGESCKVTHTAEYGSADSPAGRKIVSGEYLCSGAPTLGWPLYAGLVALAIGVGSAAYLRLNRVEARL